MAEVNGISKLEDTGSVSASHLGKRKRTVSPEVAPKDSAVQSALQDLLRILRKHDTTPSLLKYPLPPKSEAPEAKRARLVKSESANDTIEDRILTGTYNSFHALKDDVRSAQNALVTDLSATTQNGKVESDVQVQLSKLVNVLDRYETKSSEVMQTNGEVLPKADLISQNPKQFLTLRSQVNNGVQILFSGLQVQRQPEKEEADGTPDTESSRLPNGFELTDFSPLGGDREAAKKQEKRLFGTVFRQAGRIKPLDLPHTARDVVRGNTLEFIPNSSRTENIPQNKHDYKFARLATSSWLSYSTTSNQPQQEDRRRVQPASSNNDFKAALEANSVRQGHELSPDELFSSVYSSFAPTSDNSYSLVSEKDKSRQWWKQYGEQKLSRLFRTSDTAVSLVDGESEGAEDKDEFANVVAQFEPLQDGEDEQSENTEKEVEKLLEEVSEMIETLSSYQRNRSLETIVAGTVPKPTNPEIDTFTMLRDQLNILVSSLPPFAVAKLNGDKLEELNISTRLVVEAPDYPGTGQIDDYMMRRQKIVQHAATAASRTSGTPQQVRPNYSQAQGTPMAYNSQVRNYNASVPATAAYGIRTQQSYQTPTMARPTYPQNAYQASANPYSSSRPTIQQFQRPSIQNGYGGYGSNASASAPTQPQTPGGYRPTQPGYQQRAQDNAATLARSASPQKPLVNGALGQGHQYAPRQYQAQQSQQPQTPYNYQQRQGSGTPSTPVTAAAAAGAYSGRYDGAAGDSASQTIEISR
ncbi:uncharacterized protein Z520_01614 [Fonsecaea multimorphosa CBS 102226]|uniref:Uncharacterized protein n=1 Tax=Fonsecaea multimorphosa CBS 102226 TaxID=1442371 RepID=A0A0D2J188_9EURO|nr:uncharacterized protein Z520_01614 [Fonsecaea multimorphosa CBS 102226]KIY03147.1 hypothetical protein Z520_01614 [Fonsecaea multimorphosa CBS 102226]OAL30392.1 hypothetical protein AYO22_01590 [Fonsecaea multimorphosa]